MQLPPAACFSDCHLLAKHHSGSNNASPARGISSPRDCRILSGWFLVTLRRKAGLNCNKLPQGTQRGWSCELSYSQPERADGSLQIRTAIALPAEFGEEIVSQSIIVHLVCCLSTSLSTTYVCEVCFYGKSSDCTISVISASYWLPRATPALQESVTQHCQCVTVPRWYKMTNILIPVHVGHSPTKSLLSKQVQSPVALARKIFLLLLFQIRELNWHSWKTTEIWQGFFLHSL